MKTAFLVVGAQRSGTSVVSHMLSELGVNFGDRDRFIQSSYYHHPARPEVGHAFVDACYQRLRSGRLSAADYLDYRRNFQGLSSINSR